MRTIGKILWTAFVWFSGVLAGVLGLSTLMAIAEGESDDGCISKLYMSMFPKD